MLELVEKYYTEASDAFDLTMMKIQAYTEAAARQLQINYSEAELKVMTESGTSDDLEYLIEEANNGFKERILTSVKKAKEAIVKFFSELKDKIVSLFTKKETEEAIDKIEKKVKIFPFLKKKKIQVENYPEQKKCNQEAMSKLAKLTAKAKSGQTVSDEDVESVEKSWMEKHGKQVGVAAAIVATLGTAIVLYKRIVKGSTKECNNMQSVAEDALDNAMNAAEQADPQTVSALGKLNATITKVSKTAGNDLVNFMRSVLSGIKNSISMKTTEVKLKNALKKSEGSTNENTESDNDPIDDIGNDKDPWDDVMGDDISTESAIDDPFSFDFLDGEDVTEGTDDISDIFNDIVADVKRGSNPVQESTFDNLMNEIDSLLD